ncbi:MAG: flagellar protein FlaG [Alphaproteobacteria bacterium]|nr:MAG: flagellar protein FlaG [Alphaproteobacteria bacterium]
MAEINRISGLAPPDDLRGIDRVARVRPVKTDLPAAGGRGAPSRSGGKDASADSAVSPSGSNNAVSSGEEVRVPGVASTAFDRLVPSDDPRQDIADRLGKVLKDVLGDDFNSRRLRIDQDEATGRFVYKVVNADTGEVVRQFPPEEILRIVASIREAEGLVLDSRA